MGHRPGDVTEFIEFQNISSGPDATTLDLSGVTITQGPSEPFVFVPGTALSAGEYLLVVKDQVSFVAAYPAVDPSLIAGQFQGSLSNGGEQVKVEDAGNSTILDFSYDNDWFPDETDAGGRSLVIVDPESEPANWDEQQGWGPSGELGGSPGAAGSLLSDINNDRSVCSIWRCNRATLAHRTARTTAPAT